MFFISVPELSNIPFKILIKSEKASINPCYMSLMRMQTTLGDDKRHYACLVKNKYSQVPNEQVLLLLFSKKIDKFYPTFYLKSIVKQKVKRN